MPSGDFCPDSIEDWKAENRKLKQKLKDHTQRNSFDWIYHFVDIIFVATLYRIDQVFEQCGADFNVFLIVAAYFMIMFQTRNHFDVYALTFKVKTNNDIPRIIVFLIYCLAVYNMTFSIKFDDVVLQMGDSINEKFVFGECERDVSYDQFFAGSFIGSRLAMLALYLYHYLISAKGSTNPVIPPLVYRKFLFQKVGPIVISTFAMMCIFNDNFSPIAIFPFVALAEFVGDRLGDLFVSLPENLKPDAHHYQERLGLMFMLVLGETMIGLLFYDTSEKNELLLNELYPIIISGFVIVAAIGMQFFERAQSDVHEHGVTSKHPMSNPFLYGTYIWLHFLISFAMLLATSGVTELYYAQAYHEISEEEKHTEYGKISYGLFTVWITMLVMELMQPKYRANLLAYLPSVPSRRVTSTASTSSNKNDPWLFSIEQYIESIDHFYCKFLFLVKIIVAIMHLVLYFMRNDEHLSESRYVSATAIIASIPSFCDIVNLCKNFVSKLRENQRRSMMNNNLTVAHRDARIASLGQKSEIIQHIVNDIQTSNKESTSTTTTMLDDGDASSIIPANVVVNPVLVHINSVEV